MTAADRYAEYVSQSPVQLVRQAAHALGAGASSPSDRAQPVETADIVVPAAH
ncbi:hypothetical protein ACFC08_31395 [Streptomyces sp. NPDC056112]|uniref:hypothetical protein n=1 Tax=Streptomyces sp. NPDC056112 TaxID=3345715 RepID=UPI0035D9A999